MKNLIIFHGDADGICSAALLTIYLMKNDEFPVDFLSPDFDVTIHKFLIKRIYQLQPERIYILDIPSSTLNYEFFKDFETVVVDHHPYEEEPEVKRFIYSKEYCTSYLTYKNFFSGEETAWIAAIGCLGDKDEKSFREFLEISKRIYNIDENFFFRALGFIASSRMFGIRGKKAAILSLIEANNIGIPTMVLGSTPNSQKLERYREKSVRLKNNIVGRIENYKVLENDDFLVVRISVNFPIQSYLAGSLAHLNPNKLVIVINEYKKTGFIEGRTKNEKFDVGRLLKDICEKLNGIGGGHKLAGGGKIPREKVEEFIEILKQKG